MNWITAILIIGTQIFKYITPYIIDKKGFKILYEIYKNNNHFNKFDIQLTDLGDLGEHIKFMFLYTNTNVGINKTIILTDGQYEISDKGTYYNVIENGEKVCTIKKELIDFLRIDYLYINTVNNRFDNLATKNITLAEYPGELRKTKIENLLND